jgi:hypothetical protein
MGIQKAALIAFVASVAGIIGPDWKALSRLLALGVAGRSRGKFH